MPLSRMRAPFVPWAVLPAKRFGRAKTRLGAALPPPDRREFARTLFERVLSACMASRELAGTLVASDGDDVSALALRRGASVVRDVRESDASATLASVVDAALRELRVRGGSHALVIMGDLPLLQARDVREALAALRDSDVVLVPDAQRRGTSALGLRLDVEFGTAFGHGDSLERHLRAAARAGLSARVLYNPRIAVDVDTPRDLVQWAARWAE